MSKKIFNAVLQLRRDNDYNYKKIAETFVPAKGEVCLVDTARQGLQAVIGDGVTKFGELEYTFSNFEKGYFIDGKFYKDSLGENEISGQELKIYYDYNSSAILHYQDGEFITITQKIPTASASAPGVMKLYSTIGQNEDGTMTQKAITDELNEKFEIELEPEQELIIFIND